MHYIGNMTRGAHYLLHVANT